MGRKCAGQIAAESPNSVGGTQVTANGSLAINPTLDFVVRETSKGSGLACSKTADAYIPTALARLPRGSYNCHGRHSRNETHHEGLGNSTRRSSRGAPT